MNGAKHRFALGVTCFFLIGLTVVYPFLLYTPNAFVTRWREWYIETAMGTMTPGLPAAVAELSATT